MSVFEKYYMAIDVQLNHSHGLPSHESHESHRPVRSGLVRGWVHELMLRLSFLKLWSLPYQVACHVPSAHGTGPLWPAKRLDKMYANASIVFTLPSFLRSLSIHDDAHPNLAKKFVPLQRPTIAMANQAAVPHEMNAQNHEILHRLAACDARLK